MVLESVPVMEHIENGKSMIESVFEILLESLDEQGVEQHGDSWDDLVADSLDQLQADYRLLIDPDREEIGYRELAAHAADVFKYAIGRAEFTYQMLVKHRAKLGRPLFPAKTARITSFGGGPGSELVGIVKYMLDKNFGEHVEQIEYFVFDKNKEWKSVCDSIVDVLSQYIPINITFFEVDLCDKKSIGKIDLSGDHLLVLSYIISEISGIYDPRVTQDVLRSAYKTLDVGAAIFYNDNHWQDFYRFFNESKKFVTGVAGRDVEVSEIAETIRADLTLGENYSSFVERFGSLPHTTSKALSKLLVRTRS